MGKQQPKRDDKKLHAKRVELLQKIGLPYPQDLAGHAGSAALINIYTEAAGRFAGPLGEERTPANLRRSARESLRYLDELLGDIPATINFSDLGRSTIDCREACNYCCHLWVTTSAPVVLALAFYLQKKLDDGQMAELILRMEKHATENAVLSTRDRVFRSRLCPLNVNGLCIGYEYRPHGCRSYHSFNVSRCRERMETENVEVPVPMDPLRRNVEAIVVRAADSCSKGFGLREDELELIPALLIAFRIPEAAERYLAGEDVFATAKCAELSAFQVNEFNRKGLTQLPQV